MKRFLILATVVTLSACSQSRRSYDANLIKAEIWEPQQLCANNTGQAVRICLEVTLDITQNYATLQVVQLGSGYNPAQIPYRLLVRKAGESKFVLLADNITKAVGGTFEVDPKAGTYIEEYEEWRIETTKNSTTYAGNMTGVAAGKGIPLAQDIMDWPELSQ